MVREIRDWPRTGQGPGEALSRDPTRRPRRWRSWRAGAEREIAARGRLLDGKGPHAAHLAAMPEDRERLQEAGDMLDRQVAGAMRDELRAREAEAVGDRRTRRAASRSTRPHGAS